MNILTRSQEYPFKSLAKYPGMRPNDVAIWDRFLLENPMTFERVWYNIHLGDPVRYEDMREEMQENGMLEVSQWCIDVVAAEKNNLWIIEVKPNAAAGAIGQAIAYTALMRKELPHLTNIYPMVITDDASPITEEAARMLGVPLHQTADRDRK